MNTLLLDGNRISDIEIAAKLIRNGETVGMPTETVYGLAADARNEAAVAKIFEAKGRPADNPLIVHIAEFSQAELYTSYIPELAYRLAERFCPGALTMILPKNGIIPSITSGGLDTVGIRVPSHETARKLIELSGCPIAAPSANISGRPSPTSASHVMADMNGKISAVLDGGECEFGVESTVIKFDDNAAVRILRPGGVTFEDLCKFADRVIVDDAVISGEICGRVESPGMKYRHYAPTAKVFLVEADCGTFNNFAQNMRRDGIYFIAYGDEVSGGGSLIERKYVLSYGTDSEEQARRIFAVLREIDQIGAESVYIRLPAKQGIGLAVYNRLLRAGEFEVIRL